MPIKQYRNSKLFIENVNLADVAEVVDTPAYLYSRSAIENAYREYRNALDQDSADAGSRHKVCYAVKANSNLAVLNTLAKLGSGFDIVSVGELERVLAAGGDPAGIVFSGVAKKVEEIERALEAGIHCFNVESLTELGRISAIAAAHGIAAPVSIRVNPDVDAETHPYIATGLQENKFGIDIEDAESIYLEAAANENLRVIGVDCHIGSQLTTMQPFEDALSRVLRLIDTLAAENITLGHLDIGGGLGVVYKDEQPPRIQDYIGALLARLGDRPIDLYLEPGRSIVANAGFLLTRVDTLKSNPAKNFAIVDAAMNDMLRPALYDSWMEILPASLSSNADVKQYDIVGPVCETGDFLGKDRALALNEGDLLCMNSAGAYGFVMASNYNSRPRAAEVMIDCDTFHVVRDRESFADLIRGERLLP